MTDHVSFPISGPHKIGPMSVFRGAWWPRILGLIAVFPFVSFPVQLALFIYLEWPYKALEATIIALVPVPVFAWLLAAATQTTDAFVWRSYFGVPALRREPWRKVDVLNLPAVAWQRLGDTQSLVPVIDALDDEITAKDRNPDAVEGKEFDPYRFVPSGENDEMVSMMLRTEAAEAVYAARKVKDPSRNLKIGGMLVLLGIGMFMIWFTAVSLAEPPPVPPA